MSLKVFEFSEKYKLETTQFQFTNNRIRGANLEKRDRKVVI
jgi:hypothetical protein